MILKALNNRWGYALTAFIVGTAAPLMLDFIHRGDGTWGLGDYKYVSLIIGLSAAIAAIICWPSRSKRTSVRMGIAGLLTAILTLFLAPVIMALVHTKLRKFYFDTSNISALIGWPMVFFIYGSILTTGIPHIIGICASMLFVDRSIIKTDDT